MRMYIENPKDKHLESISEFIEVSTYKIHKNKLYS